MRVEHRDDHVADRLALRLRELADVLRDRLLHRDHADAVVVRDELVHVEDAGGVEHRAAVRHRDHRERVLAALRGHRGAVDRVDRDVRLRAAAGPDVLAVEEHRRAVLLALADHDDAVELDGAEERAHRVDRCAVGRELVALADEGHRTDRRRLGGTHELHRQVAIRSGHQVRLGHLQAPSAGHRTLGTYSRRPNGHRQ
jgi:hypothetical protein